MKVAIVYDAIYPYVVGGVERRIGEIASRLAGKGDEVHLFGMKFWEGPSRITRDGVVLHGVCRPLPLYGGGRRSIIQALWFSVWLLFPLAKGRYDVIECQNFPYFSVFTAKKVSLLKNTPLVVTWHEVWDRYWYEYMGPPGYFGRVIERIVVRLTGDNIAVSRTTASMLTAIGGGKGIRVIHNGLNLVEIAGIPPSANKSDLLYVGRLIREKNVALILEALVLLKDEFPTVRCVIVGNGPERVRLENISRDLGLRENVEFLGFVPRYEDILALMKASRIFVFPSQREGFGMVVLEAIACGLPVVTADVPRNAARDLITPETGVLTRLEPKDLCSKITSILKGDQPKADHPAIGEFDWDVISGKWTEYMHSVRAAADKP